MSEKEQNGCWNCNNNGFGICEIYGEPNEADLVGCSCCDLDYWEKVR